MLYAWLTGILFLVCAGVGVYLSFMGHKKKKRGTFLGGTIGGVLAFLLFITISPSFKTVDAGEIAVVKEMGKIIDTREAGTHFDFWMVRSYDKYDTKVRAVDVTTAAYSHDKQPMDIEMTIQFQIKKENVKDIALKFGGLLALESKIQSVAIERMKSVLSGYDADSIIETRGTISSEVAETVELGLENYYIDITNVSLTNIDFSNAYEQSVEQSMIAKQEVEKAKAEAEKAIAAAKGELEVAKLQAQARLEEAKADADAQKLIAEAEAIAVKLKSIEMARALGFEIIETEVQGDLIVDDEGNAVLDENGNEQYEIVREYTINFADATESEIQLLADYMQYIEYLSKWDGKLPTVVGSDSLSIFLPNGATTEKQ